MPAGRFYTDSPLLIHPLTLHGDEVRHLHVMRLGARETIELVNGRGERGVARIESIDKQQAHLVLLSYQMEEPDRINVVLAQALPRPTLLEWIVEKGTELGVSEFWLFPGEKSCHKRVTAQQLHRLKAITIAALKQCGRVFLPRLIPLPRLNEWSQPSGSLFFGETTSTTTLHPSFATTPTVLFIGPESGWAPSELHLLRGWGGEGIHLHDNTLRAETAAIAAVSQFWYASRSESLGVKKS